MVADLMTRLVVTAEESTPFRQLVSLLDAHRISALPVVDGRGRVVGVVSQIDLLRKGPGAEAGARTARELMSAPAITITPDAGILDAARLLDERGIRRLIVVDKEGRPIGVISRSDVIQVFLRQDSDLRDEILDRVRTKVPRASDVEVDVRDGVVTLFGWLTRRGDAKAVQRLAAGVPGVLAVQSDLIVADDRRGVSRRDGSPNGSRQRALSEAVLRA